MVISHNDFMKEALLEAKKAFQQDEVPIGAIIVKDQQIISRSYNSKEKNQDVTQHAEINAIRLASQKLESWHLNECDLYVTIEPCAMCAGAIIQSHIRNVYYGAKEPKTGAHVSTIMLFDTPGQPKVNVYSGVEEVSCQHLMLEYFKLKRIK